jgi:hypothetical protein
MAQFQDEDQLDLGTGTGTDNPYTYDSESENSIRFMPITGVDHALVRELDNFYALRPDLRYKAWSDFGFDSESKTLPISRGTFSGILSTISDIVSATVYTILTYIIGILVAAYIIVQAMEAVSFVLSPHGGLLQKSAWLLYLFAATVFIILVIEELLFDAVGLHFDFPVHLWA